MIHSKSPFYQILLLNRQEQSTRVFDCLLDFAQESYSFPAVNQPVIVRQSNEHHGTNNHLRQNQFTKVYVYDISHYRSFLNECPSTWPLRATGRSNIPCIPRIADWGGLMIGVPNSDPKTPPLEIVNVPPSISSTANALFFAFSPKAAIAFSMSA